MKQVLRVKTKKELENRIDDKQTEGYELKSSTERQAEFLKRNYGSALWHIVIFIFTVWWSLGLGNIAYFLYSFLINKDEVTVKIE